MIHYDLSECLKMYFESLGTYMTPLNKLFGVFVHYKDRFSAVSDGPWGFTRWWRPMPSRWSVEVLVDVGVGFQRRGRGGGDGGATME